MGMQLEKYVYRGYFDNSQRNCIRGGLELFRPPASPGEEPEGCSVTLDLAGSLPDEWAGRKFEFEMPEENDVNLLPKPADMQSQQVGPFGTIRYVKKSVPKLATRVGAGEGEAGHDAERSAEMEQATEMRPVLYIDWFSQNGHMVLEVVDPLIEFKDGKPPIAATDDRPEPANETHGLADRIAGLTLSPQMIETKIRAAAQDYEASLLEPRGAGSAEAANKLPSWSETMPSISADLAAKFDRWDELSHGTHEVPIRDLIATPLRLPKPEDLQSEEEAWQALKAVLSALAMYGIAFQICAHFTAQKTYERIVQSGLNEIRVHPKLVESSWVQYYDTHAHCKACQIEMGFLDPDDEEEN